MDWFKVGRTLRVGYEAAKIGKGIIENIQERSQMEESQKRSEVEQLRRKEYEEKQKIDAIEKLKQTPYCIKCDKELSIQAKFCKHCGGNELISQYDKNRIESEFFERQKSAELLIIKIKSEYRQTSGLLICPKCKALYSDIAIFCEKCGTAVQIITTEEIIDIIKKNYSELIKGNIELIKYIIDHEKEDILKYLQLDAFVFQSEYQNYKERI
ncbi:MAG: zinc ribbon domain-containing protein [Smithella sp.]|jgi:ribosomal protein L40E